MERENWNITRSNLRKKAVKRVNQLFQSLNDEDISVEDNTAENNVEHEVVASGFDLPSNSGSESNEESESFDEDNHVDQEEDIPNNDLAGCLRDWATHFGVSLIALSALLTILKFHHPFLPKDARTLLKTQTCHSVASLASGSFYYFGIQKMFSHFFEKLTSVVQNQHSFKLQLNIDGLPVFKSSGIQFWPILGMLQGYSRKPVLIALFCGNSKPQSLSEYLNNLICELKSMSTGFVVNGKTFFLTVSSVICDAPARAFVKGIKSHNGYSGCDKCVQPGIYINNRMTFPELDANVRTDISFLNAEDEDHHLKHSPFCETSVPMVSGFPHDYMHLVCLGVMRRLLDLWVGACGKLRSRISSTQVKLISDKLVALRSLYLQNLLEGQGA
ncbi:Tolloid-like protein 2 [Labeo rohita]|uniref:Tolloid-like protein 2 n=1 Tax=Labeo rohita TaxID=84645 RepID=A0ABQ8LAG4_LABRO|nr:Tolloid-like protein 2 [Labeo rohita]